MQATPLTHPLSSSSAEPSLTLTDPSPVLVLTDPPPSTHPSSKPTYTFISFLSPLNLIVNAKYRLEPCILFLLPSLCSLPPPPLSILSLPPFKSTHPWSISLSPPLEQPPLTRFQPSFSIYLSLSSSPSLFDRVWKLMVLLCFLFL